MKKSMFSLSIKKKIKILLLITFLFLFGSPFGLSSSSPSVIVENATAGYLHVRAGSNNFAYVEPNTQITFYSDLASLTIIVEYSPGQSLSGSTSKEFTKVSTEALSCSQREGGGCTCESTGTVFYSDNGTWIITPDDFL